MIKAIIIDDEENGRETLLFSLKEVCPEVEVVAQADSAISGLKAIEQHKPDLVFLDIEMPYGTGFDLLQNISKIDFEIIFTTAYDQYAIKAFKFSAIDYLLKPINLMELKSAVEKVQKRQAARESELKYELLKDNMEEKESSFHRIALPTNDGLEFMEIKDIIRLEASGNYTMFYMAGGKKIIVGKTLKEYEELLEEHNFFRTHKSHLINLQYLKKYIKGTGGIVVMSDDSEIEVAKRRKEAFLDKLAKI